MELRGASGPAPVVASRSRQPQGRGGRAADDGGPSRWGTAVAAEHSPTHGHLVELVGDEPPPALGRGRPVDERSSSSVRVIDFETADEGHHALARRRRPTGFAACRLRRALLSALLRNTWLIARCGQPPTSETWQSMVVKDPIRLPADEAPRSRLAVESHARRNGGPPSDTITCRSAAGAAPVRCNGELECVFVIGIVPACQRVFWSIRAAVVAEQRRPPRGYDPPCPSGCPCSSCPL